MDAAYRLQQLLGRQPQTLVDVVAGRPQHGQAPLGQLLGDEDPGHGPMLADPEGGWKPSSLGGSPRHRLVARQCGMRSGPWLR